MLTVFFLLLGRKIHEYNIHSWVLYMAFNKFANHFFLKRVLLSMQSFQYSYSSYKSYNTNSFFYIFFIQHFSELKLCFGFSILFSSQKNRLFCRDIDGLQHFVPRVLVTIIKVWSHSMFIHDYINHVYSSKFLICIIHWTIKKWQKLLLTNFQFHVACKYNEICDCSYKNIPHYFLLGKEMLYKAQKRREKVSKEN